MANNRFLGIINKLSGQVVGELGKLVEKIDLVKEIQLKALENLNGNFFVSVEKWPHQALVIPRIQAHRGSCSETIKENTIEAFREARRRGVLMFECDVRLSKDKVPVVFHDEDLLRMVGNPVFVSELTAKELKQLAQVSTLQEVLVDPLVPRLVNIELKSKIKIDDSLERRVAEVIADTKSQGRVLFSSFNPMSLFRIGLHLPDVPRALLVTAEDDPDNSILLKKMLAAPFFSFHLLHLDHRMVDEAVISYWRKKRIPVVVWTVNGKDEIQRYLKMGAMSVITDTV